MAANVSGRAPSDGDVQADAGRLATAALAALRRRVPFVLNGTATLPHGLGNHRLQIRGQQRPLKALQGHPATVGGRRDATEGVDRQLADWSRNCGRIGDEVLLHDRLHAARTSTCSSTGRAATTGPNGDLLANCGHHGVHFPSP